jgi:hypothetical protein
VPQNLDLPLDKARPDNDSKVSPSKKEHQNNAALEMLASQLNHKLSEYVGKRYDKEREWQIAEELYNGSQMAIDDKKLAALREVRGGELPAVNITRPKTNIAIARLQDIQFPLGGDFNFSVGPTPVPELLELANSDEPLPVAEPAPAPMPPMAGPPGMAPQGPPGAMPAQDPAAAVMPEAPAPMTIGEAAHAAIKKSQDRARRMERKIHDRFVETDWAKKSRKAMEQWGVLGTACLKAPVLVPKRRRSYKPLKDAEGKTIFEMQYSNDVIPTVQWVDTRMVFPDPSARAGTTIEDVFELHLMTRQELRGLAFHKAFMQNRIRECLMEEPLTGHVAKSHILPIMGTHEDALDKRFCVMEYHGPMDKEVLFELDLIDEKDKDDPLVMVQGEVWFVNNRVIRVSVSPIEGEDRIPYFFCTWEDDPSSIFGHGVPYLMRHAARVMNSSWLMLLDNAGLTAGPQIILNKEMIQPANKAEGWAIRPMKVWFMTEYGEDVNKAMQFVNVPTQQDSIANIIEMSLNFADIESSLPQIQQGEMPKADNVTFGGMAMVLTAANVIQQRLSEKWDDDITVPIVERFYHYEMQYGDDESLKGDYEVMAGGATQRIDKQIKSQDLERIMGMAGSNEDFIMQIDLPRAFREWVLTTRVGDILKPVEQVEKEMAEKQAAMQQAPDPKLIEAQARMKQADAALEKNALDRELKTEEMNMRSAIEEARVDKESREIMARQHENQIKLLIAQMQREDMLNKLAADQQATQAQIAAKLNISVMGEETKRLLKQADLDKFNTEITYAKKEGKGI